MKRIKQLFQWIFGINENPEHPEKSLADCCTMIPAFLTAEGWTINDSMISEAMRADLELQPDMILEDGWWKQQQHTETLTFFGEQIESLRKLANENGGIKTAYFHDPETEGFKKLDVRFDDEDDWKKNLGWRKAIMSGNLGEIEFKKDRSAYGSPQVVNLDWLDGFLMLVRKDGKLTADSVRNALNEKAVKIAKRSDYGGDLTMQYRFPNTFIVMANEKVIHRSGSLINAVGAFNEYRFNL